MIPASGCDPGRRRHREAARCNLSFDHSLIDGAAADRFMAKLKQHLEASTDGLG
jgi:pyruvate/2-oxoglutarate dehydrogenase complex dihydrolipoamide acyltransferase (E2) component